MIAGGEVQERERKRGVRDRDVRGEKRKIFLN
jgi:hypothetical protein